MEQKDDSLEAAEVKRLLEELQQEADVLRKICMTEEEEKWRSQISETYNAGIREMVSNTLNNMEAYRKYRWLEIFGREGDRNE